MEDDPCLSSLSLWSEQRRERGSNAEMKREARDELLWVKSRGLDLKW